jgi:hypothetical protein
VERAALKKSRFKFLKNYWIREVVDLQTELKESEKEEDIEHL